MKSPAVGCKVSAGKIVPAIEQHHTETLTPLGQIELDLPITNSPRPEKNAAARWATAIHEAGHAVVAVYYDIPIVEVHMKDARNAEIELDQEKIEPVLYTHACTRYISKQTVMAFSGFTANHKLNPEEVHSLFPCDKDLALAKIWLWWMWEHASCKRRSGRNPARQQKLTEAEIERILARHACRLILISSRLVGELFPIIQTVASALFNRQRLTGDEIVALAEPLIAKARANMTSQRAVRRSDHAFRINAVPRLPRPTSFKRLGLNKSVEASVRRAQIANAGAVR